MTTITQTIMALATRPEGFSTTELCCGLTQRQLGANAIRLVREGRLIEIGKRLTRRMFVHPKHAEAYEKRLSALMAQAAREQISRANAVWRDDGKAHDAPVRIKPGKVAWADLPVDYSRAKVTHCPSPPEFGPMAKLRGFGVGGV